MRRIRKLENAKIKDKNVLLIVDYNTTEIGSKVFKIDQTLPTIEYILSQYPLNLFIITHLGRPKDKKSHPTTFLYNYLKEKLSVPVKYMPIKEYLALKEEASRIFFGDNSRYYSQEELKIFYNNFDIIINDAFGCSHREASFRAYAGMLMEKEIEALDSALDCDLLMMGGAKIADKIKLVERFNTTIFLGGGLATSIYKRRGVEVGRNTLAEEVPPFSDKRGIVLPTDFMVVNKEHKYENKKIGSIQETDTIVDIGKESTETLIKLIEKSRSILWNGPLGKFEDPRTSSTLLIVEALDKSKAKIVVGGGETANAVLKHSESSGKNFYHISTGGGALLSFLGGRNMPGIESVTEMDGNTL